MLKFFLIFSPCKQSKWAKRVWVRVCLIETPQGSPKGQSVTHTKMGQKCIFVEKISKQYILGVADSKKMTKFIFFSNLDLMPNKTFWPWVYG